MTCQQGPPAQGGGGHGPSSTAKGSCGAGAPPGLPREPGARPHAAERGSRAVLPSSSFPRLGAPGTPSPHLGARGQGQLSSPQSP